MHKVFAQSLTIPWGDGTQTITGHQNFAFNSIGDIISGVIPYFYIFAGFGLLLMIIASGFALLTSAGDAKKLAAGRLRLTYAVVGFLIVFASYWITQVFGKILGLSEILDVFK
ncbi:MAG: hypothetical protein Q7S76_00010 [bacterium]|nr:hypothetical protein [bacterium]